ncbi:trypsin-like peptidase domain-containing protein [Streptomyces sp. NPDC001787]|uniref:nSTAND1 domain-containing NTPase n=1 Tax=Streptomyces sp. NPDC001787 TaxID=3154523 RepID=UPI003323200B
MSSDSGATAGIPDGPDDGDGAGAAGEPSAYASVFQVLDGDGGVSGSGFLTDADTGFSCAHVVRAAGVSPGGRVVVAFPNLPGAPRVSAGVVAEGWRAPEAEDIALLQFDSVPAGARGMAVGVAAGCRGHRVYSFGFPAQAPSGGHFGYAEAGDPLPAGDGSGQLLQLSRANDLTTGFSGGPVVDEKTGLVIGMVTAITAPDAHLKGLGIAYATPAEALREVLPRLPEHRACPYLGLKPFTDRHSDWFHGRDAAVERVLAALDGNRGLLMLLGPSGAGKSSLVNAGVLPALAGGAVPGSDRWLTLTARPGHDLLAELEAAGLPGAATEGLPGAVRARLAAEPDHDHLLLIIDQFEELLTRPEPDPASRRPADDEHRRAEGERLRAEDERLRAAGQLVELAESHAAVTVLLIMRNDFYVPLDAFAPDLMQAALPGLCNVPATLSRSELKAIITGPAEAVGLPLETGLADRIVNDVLDAGPGARQAPVTLLPPLELALRRLWERRRREDGLLTHAGYERIGKVTGSLTTWCNSALGHLPAEQRPTARRMLTALVRPADEANSIPATRRPVPLTRLRALAADPDTPRPEADAAFDVVLASLSRHRVITTGTTTPPGASPGEPTAELIHDTLIRDWADLRDWVAQDHQFQVWLQRAAEQQAHHTRSGLPGDLPDGSLLADGEKWAKQRPLPAEITALIRAGRQHQQAAVRRTKRINTILAGLLGLALVATGVAFYQQDAAVTAQHAAQSRQLAALSAGLTATDPDLSSLLAVKAWRTSRTDEAAGALYAAPAVPLRQLFDAGSEVRAVAFGPDGGTLATGSGDGAVRLWDVGSGKVRAELTAHTKGVSSVAFSPDGGTLATGSDDGRALLWDVSSGKALRTLTHSKGVSSVAFSPDGGTLATAGLDGTARLWDATTGRARPPVMKGGAVTMTTAVFSPDGTMLATGGAALPLPGSKDAVDVWDARTGEHRRTLAGTGIAQSVAFSPDSATLAVTSGGAASDAITTDTSGDRVVRLWDMRTGKDLTLPGTVNASSVAFSPDGAVLATGSLDGSVHLWNARTGDPGATFFPTPDVYAVVFSPDGSTLATAGSDGTARLWDVKSSKPRATLTGADEDLSVWSTAFSRDGSMLATGSENGVRLWDGRTGAARGMLRSDDGIVHSAVFSSDGDTVVTGSTQDDEGTVRLWDVRTETVRTAFTVGKDDIWAVDLSPDGSTVATGARNGPVRLRDARTGAVRATLTGPREARGVWSVAFSPDGTMLAAGTDKGARLWDVKSGKDRVTLVSREEEVHSVSFGPDAGTLLGGNRDGATYRWNVRTGKVRTAPIQSNGAMWSVDLSPDGTLLADGSVDGAVRLWDLTTGKVRITLTGHTGMVNTVSFSPDGTRLATGAGDGTARLWDLPVRDAPKIAASICDKLDRDFTKAEKAQYLRDQDPAPVCLASGR